MAVYYIFSAILALYLFGNSIYILVFAIAAKYKKPKQIPMSANKPDRELKFAIIIPAYRNDHVILETLPLNLAINYPKDKFRIIVAADGLQPDTIAQLSTYDADILDLHLIKSSKVKAIHHTEFLIRDKGYDYVVMLDIDNEMEKEYLQKLNSFLQPDMVVVQTHRTAKNLDTPFSVLDAMSEEVNNSVFRKGHSHLGLSAALIGSGVIMRSDYFTSHMMGWKAVGGFDKELELEIASLGLQVFYAEDIYVYDEKTRYIGELKMQRRRWLSAQIFYFRKNIFRSIKTFITNGNLNYLNKIIQLTLLPRIFLLGLFFILTMAQWLFYSKYLLLTAIGLCINIAAILIAMPKRFYKKEFIRSVVYLPFAFLIILLSLARLKGANRKFISTPHHSKQN